MATNTYLSTITLNANALNAPIKKHGDKMNNKIRALYSLSTRNSLQVKRHTDCK